MPCRVRLYFDVGGLGAVVLLPRQYRGCGWRTCWCKGLCHWGRRIFISATIDRLGSHCQSSSHKTEDTDVAKNALALESLRMALLTRCFDDSLCHCHAGGIVPFAGLSCQLRPPLLVGFVGQG